MKTLKNLGYRIKRFFQGESGIVEKVDYFTEFIKYENGDYVEDEEHLYLKDDLGKFPEKITFRTPLGESIAKVGYTERTSFSKFEYKSYKPGDKFP